MRFFVSVLAVTAVATANSQRVSWQCGSLQECRCEARRGKTIAYCHGKKLKTVPEDLPKNLTKLFLQVSFMNLGLNWRMTNVKTTQIHENQRSKHVPT